MSKGFLLTVLAICGALAGCGDTVGEQALYGAGAGVAGAAVLDGDVVTGAAVGPAAMQPTKLSGNL